MTMSKENSNVHVLENFVSSLKHACMHELGNFSKLKYINKMLSLLNKEKRIWRVIVYAIEFKILIQC